MESTQVGNFYESEVESLKWFPNNLLIIPEHSSYRTCTENKMLTLTSTLAAATDTY